jgi:hypothetical protein
MGKNKDLRKQSAGYLRVIEKHRRKLEEELRKSQPDEGLVRKWRNDIEIFTAQLEETERKLRKGKSK